MVILRLFFHALLTLSIATAYKLDKNLDASNFLDSFNFIDGHDRYQEGYADYVSKDEAMSMGLARIINKQIYLSVDNTSVVGAIPQGGRKSVRLESYDTIDRGLIIADFAHLPANACGMWPAFWLLHDEQHNGDFCSKIDIVESISYFSRNEINMSVRPNGCTMTAEEGTEEVIGTDCNYDAGGCGAIALYGSFGDSFNLYGGGFWATQIEADGIKVWHFKRALVPSDIVSEEPDPDKWGTPVMSFTPKDCDIGSVWKKMRMVINMNFCGRRAGGDAWNEYTGCRERTGVASCSNYVATVPDAFSEVYFLIHSIKTYI